MPLNTVAKNAAVTGASGVITHGAIFSASDPGTGTNANAVEATGGSPAYARVAITWGTAASELISNTNAMTFDVPAGTYAFVGYFNASTGNTNNYRGYAPINGAASRGFGTAATTDTITSNGHGLANTDRVQVFNVFAESLPSGLTEGTLYFVINTATDTFQLSATSGGAAVDITTVGDLFWAEVIPETFASQGQITIAAGALQLDATGI